jgi:YVTN family beta-propeller protein
MFAAESVRLPTGQLLDPAVSALPVGNFPLAIAAAPEGNRFALLLCGYRQQGVQIVDGAGAVLQTVEQPAAFVGLAFAPDGKTLWASGGNEDRLYRYTWRDGVAVENGSVELAVKQPKHSGTRYPAGLAFSRDGRRLYVAENLSDTLAVVDVDNGRVVQRVETDRYPYAVAVAKTGEVFVSAWGDDTVTRFRNDRDGLLHRDRRIVVGRHPSAMLLDDAGGRLFVASSTTDSIAIVDTRRAAVVKVLADPPPAGPHEGSTPNAVALSADGATLFVAEADANAIAVFALSAASSGRSGVKGGDALVGRIPVEWYPTALAVSGDRLIVVNGKGRGTRPNPDGPQPGRKHALTEYTLGQIRGSLMTLPLQWTAADLAAMSRRVAAANGWGGRTAAKYPPLRHVIYIIKENRTYDQILGDVTDGDGDASLVYFPREVTPNHHALAQRFGLFDRFFVNAEVSADGHNWSTAAYATDYAEKTVPSEYSSRGRSYDYEGSNRGAIVDEDDDVNAPANGYLWDLAIRKGISLRDYGEFVLSSSEIPSEKPGQFLPTRRALLGVASREYPPWDLDIPDQRRADVWIADLQKYAAAGTMPALQILRLPNDHTFGAKADKPTPRAYVADNDLALGRIIEALSHSPFWKDSVVFVLEDDAQNGPDHVDSHRAPLIVVSPWCRGGLVHRFANTTDVLATIEEILGLDSLSQFDFYGRPLRGIFAAEPDLRAYDALKPAVDLNEKNPPDTPAAKQSSRLDFSRPDAADEAVLNQVLWTVAKGNAPMPPPRRAPAGAP